MVVPTDVVLAENDEAIGLVGVVGLVEGVGVDAHVAIGVGGVVVVVVETVVVVNIFLTLPSVPHTDTTQKQENKQS